MKFFVREILDATPRSRVASQFGAQKGDRASNRLTRRPATHNPNPIHAHVPTRLRIVCEKFTLVAVACSRTVRGRAWSQTRAVRGRAHLRGLNMIADCSRTRTNRVHGLRAASSRLRTDRGHVHNSGKWHGCSAFSPRLIRGHRILSWLRGQACLVKSR